MPDEPDGPGSCWAHFNGTIKERHEKPIAATALHELQCLGAKGRLEDFGTKEHAAGRSTLKRKSPKPNGLSKPNDASPEKGMKPGLAGWGSLGTKEPLAAVGTPADLGRLFTPFCETPSARCEKRRFSCLALGFLPVTATLNANGQTRLPTLFLHRHR